MVEQVEEKKEIEYCQDCLDGKCEEHEWFGKPKTEKEILINNLKMINNVLPSIIERIYLLKTVLGWRRAEERGIFFGEGKINFVITATTASHKKDGKYYIPVNSYACGAEGIVDFYVEIEATIARHNPMTLRIYENRLSSESIFTIHLINDDDFLHCEEIKDYNGIVDLAKNRLGQFVEVLMGKS